MYQVCLNVHIRLNIVEFETCFNNLDRFYAVLEVGDGVFEVLSTSGDTHLGGDDFDKVRTLHVGY